MTKSEQAPPNGPATWRAEIRAQMMADANATLASGNMAGVLRAVVAAAAGDEPMPQWARVALWRITRGLNTGEIGDLNEAFGWSKEETSKPAPQWAKEVLVRHRASLGLPTSWEDELTLRTEPVGHQAKRKSEAKMRHGASGVLQALKDARAGELPMTVQTFEELAEKLGESRDFIEKVYFKHSKEILNVKPGQIGSGGVFVLNYWE